MTSIRADGFLMSMRNDASTVYVGPHRGAGLRSNRLGGNPWVIMGTKPDAHLTDPTYADAVLDRLVHNAHRIELTGESLRRERSKQAKSA